MAGRADDRAAPRGGARGLPPPARRARRPSRFQQRAKVRWAAVALLVLPGAARAEHHATFSVDYVVRISRRDPSRAHVRWLLAGIDEIRSFRIVFRDDRMAD